MRENTVVVTGGRNLDDDNAWGLVQLVLNYINDRIGIGTIVHGDADGIDTLCRNWAWKEGVDTLAFPAKWSTLGNRAGAMRNQQMLDEALPDCAVVFPGGKGTADMLRRVKFSQLPYFHVETTDTELKITLHEQGKSKVVMNLGLV